ncbi:MAG TPA: ester cyclase [Flavipsychrobacter sp.]|nr:ester cyclase [Flavipsychrobacter sp.]
MSDSIRQLVIRLHDAFSKNEFEKVLELCTDDVTVQAYAFGLSFYGKDGFMGFMQGFKSAFPDMAIMHKNMLVDGNRVAVEFTGNGTHTGTLQTPAGVIAPTGKTLVVTACEFMEWENGKLKRLHNYQDAGSLMLQIS